MGHGYMRGYVQIEEEADYQVWLQDQQTFAALSADAQVGLAEVDN